MPTAPWFIAQLSLCLVSLGAGAALSRGSRRLATWVCIACLSLLLLWPAVRFWPTAPISLLGARVASCLEVTGLFIPATLLFVAASHHLGRPGERRALRLLACVCVAVFVRVGWWMISPGVPDLGTTTIIDGIARQSTGYTCAAASMVTLLRARGIDASETEMARLARTEVGGGATDSRVLWALQEKLRTSRHSVSYQSLDLDRLLVVPKPCLVQLDWGFFVSHMVPVLEATRERVVIGDPLSGRRELSATDFARTWKHAAVIVE